ncbi:host attachment family protein [Kaistia dalseonensis]|uniref:Protein required for attachment to host cells n=1 Tax=Kaistia dalseonensis TaxID=410840 RepID=A0ABU0H4N0_9HYPH|nr:host attachment family protein [Kaistia dalseonensis]MCX5493870.1 host attachment family protein [Kaistia dalseonensis]MDQ0436436.1 protein required for attachment to host cells [Kaistia dalseonensis]
MAEEMIKVPRKSWVVVCDGAKALLFENDGDAELINLKLVENLDQPDPANRDIGTDRPGRVYQSHGSARSSVEEPDWHAEAEAKFLALVADHLDKAVTAHQVKQVILVAPPRALGILRQRLSDGVRAVVKHEIAKDLAGLSTGEIERHLASA